MPGKYYLQQFYFLVFCGGNLTAEFNPQNFSTPFYPSRSYGNNLFCDWLITAPSSEEKIVLFFFLGSTESCCDRVQVSTL